MTTTIQLSDKRGDAILVVKAEYDSPEQAEAQFAAAAGLAGLGAAYEAFGAAAPATIPSITQLTQPQQPAWGQPPVPPMQAQYNVPPQVPAAAQQYQPAAQPLTAGPVCQHGPKELKSGVGAKGPWSFWGCKARQDDPSKCEKEWVR